MAASKTDAVVILTNKLDQLQAGVISEELFNDQELNEIAQLLTCQSVIVFEASKLVAALFSHATVKKTAVNKLRLVLDALFVCLKNNGNLPTLQHLLAAIGHLADEKDPIQNWLVKEFDAINVIVDILKKHSPNLADLQAQAYYALQKIAMGNEANIRVLFNTFLAHELALTSMTNHATHVPLQIQACALLRRLSYITETKSTLKTTASLAIIQSMRSFAAEPEIQEHGSTFINNLSDDPETVQLFVREPYLAHELILSAMRNYPQIVVLQEKGCGALCSFIVDNNYAKQLVLEPHLAHEVVLTAMCNHPHSAAVQRRGCIALSNLALDIENKKLLVAEPYLAHRAILSAMRNHPQIAAVQEQGCNALGNLATDNYENKKLLVQYDAHIAILAALRTHPQQEQVQDEAVWALAKIAVDVSNCAILQQVDALPLCEQAQRNFFHNACLNDKLNFLETRLA